MKVNGIEIGLGCETNGGDGDTTLFKNKDNKSQPKQVKRRQFKDLSNQEIDSKKVKLFELATKPGKLSRQDVTCPICWSIMIEPTTLPCKHSLCTVCYLKHEDETSLLCPVCRMRLSIWSRKAKKNDDILDKPLWNRIKSEYPSQIEARLNGEDSQPIDLCEIENEARNVSTEPATFPFDGAFPSEPGEIFSELKLMLFPHESDLKTQRLREEQESMDFAKRLQEEEQKRQSLIESIEEKDYLLALKLNAEINPKENRPLTRASKSRTKRNSSESQSEIPPSTLSLEPSNQTISPCCSKVLKTKVEQITSGNGCEVTDAVPSSSFASELENQRPTMEAVETMESINPTSGMGHEGISSDLPLIQGVQTTCSESSSYFEGESISDILHVLDSQMKVPNSSNNPQLDVEPEELNVKTDNSSESAFTLTENTNCPLERVLNEPVIDEESFDSCRDAKTRLEQELADEAYARQLQRCFKLGIAEPRVKNSRNKYNLRRWSGGTDV